MGAPPTAAILLIGNELLSGKVRDENAHFLAGELFARGLPLKRIVVVPDEIGTVADALCELLGRVDIVFTSGGIGPTHDDITVEAVARALERPLVSSKQLEQAARSVFGEKLDEAHLRMTRIPEGATLVESEETRFPVIAVERVYVLAGVPTIFRRGFRAVAPRLPRGAPKRLDNVYVRLDEWSLAPHLNRLVAAYPNVEIGSYPVMGESRYRVRITFEGTDTAAVEGAGRDLVSALPPEVVVDPKDLE